MQKDASYHKSAIQYNEELAEKAEELAEKVEHEEVQRWSRSVAKQHRFHAGRHKKALAKLESSGEKTVSTEDGGEDRVLDDERTVHKSAEDGQFVSAEEAAEHPDTTYETEVAVPGPAQPIDAAPDPTQAASPVENAPAAPAAGPEDTAPDEGEAEVHRSEEAPADGSEA